MVILTTICVIGVSYLLGSIPFGYIFVRIINGKDIRKIESGRTGGTNAMRSAGLLAGLLTALFDVLKGFTAGILAQWLLPGLYWIHVIAALMSILGHNYSFFLMERNEKGKLRFRGGAGGAPCFGGAIALWQNSWIIILPVGILVFVLIGYASVTTMSIPAAIVVAFAVRANLGMMHWEYILYGVAAEILLIWALRPNLQRLKNGTERLVGLRAYFKRKKQLTASSHKI